MLNVEDRFWAKVDKTAGPDACWPWMGCTDPKGYGRFSVNNLSRIASAVAFSLHNGRPYGERPTLHSCDNAPCCNPKHLCAGTLEQNVSECVSRGRHAHGVSQGISRLTAEMVRDARQRFVRGHKSHGATALAKEFGVSQSVMSRAVNCRSYQDVT